MKLPPEAVTELQALFKDRGIELSFEEAQMEAQHLLRLKALSLQQPRVL